MKSLLLIRHAKSSPDFDIDDFDRPLNSRGETEAAAMTQKLIKKDIKIDYFVSSPAKRALTTATFFAKGYGQKLKDITTVSSLYEPTTDAFYNVIENLDDSFTTVAVFSHNPTITEFANQLTSVKVDDLPTCAVFAVKADVKKWKEFLFADKNCWLFDYPKSD